ncbi:MAG: hypothetical protein ACOC41_03295 [Chitinivibrionales bacterium]
MTKIRKLTISEYKPGRFEYLMNEPFARDAWGYLSDPVSIQQMLCATVRGLPAIQPLLDEIESKFAQVFKSETYPDEEITILFNNMIKQIMEMHGFRHSACGLCRGGRFFKSSGLYTKGKQE